MIYLGYSNLIDKGSVLDAIRSAGCRFLCGEE